MDNKDATRTCTQCHKEVAEANFDLHVTHCRRFLCVCPDCDEAVPKDQLEQHKEEEHTQVRCSKCNKKMERRHLMDHESDECVERLQSCPFCDLSVPFKDLDEHCLVCGSRTERCRDCGRYVKLREQAEHGLTCSDESPQSTTTNSSATPTVRCARCMGSVPADDIDKHEMECAAAARWFYEEVEEAEGEAEEEEEEEEEDQEEEKWEDDFSKQGATSQLSATYKASSHGESPGPWGNGGDPYRISTCPSCHLALPLATLRWHEAKCRVYVLLK